MKPLERLYRPGEQFEISKAGLEAWRRSDLFPRMSATFYKDYPPQSLISDESRALLHHLLVMRRPERILEIGTFMGGTTEVLARAAWEAGVGHVDTIDPFGGERCPPIIAGFPAELRERISFSPVDSATHFAAAIDSNRSYDFVFIDGNHEFEYALFDALCAGRVITPSGLVVLDNIDQPGPQLATKTFLQLFPDWKDVSGVVRLGDPNRPFDRPVPSLADTALYLIEAPPFYAVGSAPRSFGSIAVDRAEVDCVELDLAAPANGQLHLHIYARTFGLPDPEELQARQTVDLGKIDAGAGGPLRIPLLQPLHSSLHGAGFRHLVEVALAYTGTTTLALRSPPTVHPAKQSASQ